MRPLRLPRMRESASPLFTYLQPFFDYQMQAQGKRSRIWRFQLVLVARWWHSDGILRHYSPHQFLFSSSFISVHDDDDRCPPQHHGQHLNASIKKPRGQPTLYLSMALLSRLPRPITDPVTVRPCRSPCPQALSAPVIGPVTGPVPPVRRASKTLSIHPVRPHQDYEGRGGLAVLLVVLHLGRL